MRVSASVAEVTVARIAALGVSCVFSVPGGLCSAFDHALHRSNIRVIVCQHEAMATYAAAGYHRATGLPGLVVVTAGPGALNCAAALAAARLDHDGVIVLAGDVATTDQGRGVLQDGGAGALDLVSVMRPLAGDARRIDSARAMPFALEQAIARAQQRSAAPTFLLVPIDVQRAQCVAPPVELPAAAAGQATAPFLRLLLENLSTTLGPTILAGRGVRSEAGVRAVIELAEALAAPLIVDADALGIFPLDHPLFLGAFGVGDDGVVSTWLSQHPPSPLIAIGARLDDTTTSAFSSALLGGGVIQLDEDVARLGRAVEPIAAFAGDLSRTLAALVRELRPCDEATLRERAKEIASAREQRPAFPSLSNAPFHPVAAAHSLLRAVPPSASVTADIGNHMLATLRALQYVGHRRFELSLGLGGMGSGLGLALGLALGGREDVVCVCGDGTLAMCGNELLTAVKYEIPVLFVAFQDGHLGMVRHGIARVYGSTDEYSLPHFDLAAWGRSIGLDVFQMEGEAGLEAAVRRSTRPRLLVVPIDPEVRFSNPREAIIHFPEAS